MVSTIVFIVVLSVLIIVHEWGHFITAKKVGVHVEKFAVGFGPKLFSWTHDGTEFAVCAFPLGGYVKLAGDDRAHSTGAEDEYCSKPVGLRALIVVMGPVINYVFAYVCLCLVFMLGYPTLSSKIGEVIEDSPALEAGLLKGDVITQIDDTPIRGFEDLKRYISQSTGNTLKFQVERDGTTIHKEIVPEIQVLENIFGQKENVRVVGIRPEEEIVQHSYSFGKSFVMAFHKLNEITGLTYKALYRMLTGAMAAKDTVTGPIGIFYIIKSAFEQGISPLLFVTAVVSASLAIFNLLPLPILDGGHLALLAIEKVRGAAIPKNVEDNILKVGLSLIICLALFVFYIDFDRYDILGKIFSIWK